MADPCRETEHRLARTTRSGDQPDGAHLEQCAVCRRQLEADEVLRDHFAGLARPSVSPHFSRQVVSRAVVEQRRLAALRRWGRVLKIYWFVAALASSVILLRLPSFADAFSSSWVVPLALVVVGVLPLAWMLRILRGDPVELVFSTFEWFS